MGVCMQKPAMAVNSVTQYVVKCIHQLNNSNMRFSYLYALVVIAQCCCTAMIIAIVYRRKSGMDNLTGNFAK